MLRFDRVCVINLARRPDRLVRFWENFPASWPFGEPEVISAIDGNLVPRPSWFTEQPGAWGCLRTHLRLYEEALCKGHDLFIFEDDVVFAGDFGERIGPFLQAVPDDWQMVYLGGLHRAAGTHPPVRVNEQVHLGRAITTTYAYGLRHEFLRVLYPLLWEAEQHHIDQMLARLQVQNLWRIYCPVPWLVGMDAGPSDICNRVYQRPHFWDYDPAVGEKVVLEQLLSRVELRDGRWVEVPLGSQQAPPVHKPAGVSR